MAQYLSEDLRARVIRAIEGGMSRNAAAHHFGVSVSSAVRWMAAYLATGRTAPKSRGGEDFAVHRRDRDDDQDGSPPFFCAFGWSRKPR